MADGQQATQDPLAESAQLEAGQVDPALVGRDPTERVLGMGVTPGGSLDRALQQHHQQRVAQAKMYRGNLASSVGQLAKGTKWDATLNGGSGGERPLTQDEISDLTAQKEEAQKNYDKIIGVNPQAKEALGKAHGIIDFILQRKQAQRQGGMPIPPTPQYGSTVGEGGVSLTPPPGSTATVMDNGVTMTPPPSPRPQPSALEQSVAAPMQRHQMGISQGLQNTQRAWQQGIDLRTKEAQKMWGDDYANNPTAQRYIATGTFPPVARMQLKPVEFTGPDGKIQRVMANYDPIQGTLEYQGKAIDNAQIADKPQLIKYMKPDAQGKPHLVGGFMLGTELFDQQMNPLPPNTEFYSRGLQGRDTLHQSITMGPDGKPIITTLESVSNPTFTKAIWGDEPQGGAQLPPNTPAVTPGGVPTGGPGASVPSRPTRQGGTSPAPRVAGGGGGGGETRAPKTTDAAGRPLGLPAGQFTAQSKAATGVDQARNSLVGDNIDKGEVSGLAKDLNVFKSPDSMKRIGEYLQLVHNQAANEGDSFAHSGDTFGAVKWFAGLPQLNISLQQGALRDQYNNLTTDDKKFVADYFRVMGTMGGMRASTGMPGYQWAFTNMYNEMPTPGKVNDYDDAVRRLMNYVNETNVVSKRNSLVSKVDVQDAEKQIRGGSTSKGAMTAPPKANSKAINF